eukprot:2900475-Pyramimonas_sp.AAC.1
MAATLGQLGRFEQAAGVYARTLEEVWAAELAPSSPSDESSWTASTVTADSAAAHAPHPHALAALTNFGHALTQAGRHGEVRTSVIT